MTTESKPYPAVRIWGQQLGSYGGYIQRQVDLANAENAPADATHRRADGSWATLSDMENTPLLKRIALELCHQLQALETIK